MMTYDDIVAFFLSEFRWKIIVLSILSRYPILSSCIGEIKHGKKPNSKSNLRLVQDERNITHWMPYFRGNGAIR